MGQRTRLPHLAAPVPEEAAITTPTPIGSRRLRRRSSRRSGGLATKLRFVADLTDNFLEVLDDQSKRGKVLKLSETAARGTLPDLLVASLGALKSDNHR